MELVIDVTCVPFTITVPPFNEAVKSKSNAN
jgi:hypothetical protein